MDGGAGMTLLIAQLENLRPEEQVSKCQGPSGNQGDLDPFTLASVWPNQGLLTASPPESGQSLPRSGQGWQLAVSPRKGAQWWELSPSFQC